MTCDGATGMVTIAHVKIDGPPPRKNRRHGYRVQKDGVQVYPSLLDKDFLERFRLAWIAAGSPVFDTGELVLCVQVAVTRTRHLDVNVPYIDTDAALSSVRDAMERVGMIDDDMRIVADATYKFVEPEPWVRVTLSVLGSSP